MASTSTSLNDEFTPRRNPRRSCARKEPWNFDNADDSDEKKGTSDIDDYEDVDFQVYTSYSQNSQPSTPGTSNASPQVRYHSRNMTPAQRKKKLKKFFVDCDPDNDDVFLHSGLSLTFNHDTLKKHIKYFMKTSGVPAYKRALNKCMKKAAYATPQRRPYKKRNPSERKKRERWDNESDDSPDTTPVVPVKRTPESTLRAMIYTRDHLKRQALQRMEAAKKANARPPRKKDVVDSEILKGVVAFVDVISHADEDTSAAIKKELEKLGAQVVTTFTKNDPVAVVLFNDGHVSTYTKAKKRGIPLVSVLWIEECRKLGERAPVDKFPPSKMERYESPEFVKELKKRKFIYATERMNPRKLRKSRRKVEETPPPETHEHKSPNSEPLASISDLTGPAWLNEIEGSSARLKFLVNKTGVTEAQFREMMNEPKGSKKYEVSPLPMRLLHEFARELYVKKSSNAAKELTSPSDDNENENENIQTNENENENIQTNENENENENIQTNENENANANANATHATPKAKEKFVTPNKKDSVATGRRNKKISPISPQENETPVKRRTCARAKKIRRKLSY